MIGIVVMGPEASGTRYVTALLFAANTDPGNRIMHRSVPYDRRFVPLDEIMAALDRNDTRAVICSRRADLLVRAAERHGHSQGQADGIRQQQRSYTWAIGECARLGVPFLLTSYESFADPDYRQWVCDWALDTTDGVQAREFGFIDGNAKYR